jgi:hypothetical protein
VLFTVKLQELLPAALIYYFPSAGIRRYTFSKAPLSHGMESSVSGHNLRLRDAWIRHLA